jgi:hypothetical protein
MNVVVEVQLRMSQPKKYRETRTAEHHGGNISFRQVHAGVLTATTPSLNASNTCNGSRGHISDITRSIPALERNDPVEANSFAVERDNFSSSPRMVQLNFFERSH